VTELRVRVTALNDLVAAGRWTRLAAELPTAERDAAAAVRACREAGEAAAALLGRRDELRGMLDAYQAKAGRLGAAEDAGLAALYERARGLLWTAPCDLGVAGAAVTGYQQAVLALDARRRRP
jgi:hypothetical protein